MAIAYKVDTQLFNLDKNKINGMVPINYKKAFDMVIMWLCYASLKPSILIKMLYPGSNYI